MGNYTHLSKEERLANAAAWLPAQYGKKWAKYRKGLLRTYEKRYGVEAKTASNELKALGVDIPKGLGYTNPAPPKPKKKKKKEDFYDNWEEDYTQDWYFAYIAGYTSGGAPFGITWEELGLDKYPWEERVRRYREGDYEERTYLATEDWEGPDEEDWDENYPEIWNPYYFKEMEEYYFKYQNEDDSESWKEDHPEEWEEHLAPWLEKPIPVHIAKESYVLCEVTDLSCLPLGEEACFLNAAGGKALFACPEAILPPGLTPTQDHLSAMIFDVGEDLCLPPETLMTIAMGVPNLPTGYCMLMGPGKIGLFYDPAFHDQVMEKINPKVSREKEEVSPDPEDLPFP